MIIVHAFTLTRAGVAYALRMAGYSTRAEQFTELCNGVPCWKENAK